MSNENEMEGVGHIVIEALLGAAGDDPGCLANLCASGTIPTILADLTELVIASGTEHHRALLLGELTEIMGMAPPMQAAPLWQLCLAPLARRLLDPEANVTVRTVARRVGNRGARTNGAEDLGEDLSALGLGSRP